MADNGIGASVRRVEDDRFLTGRGTFTDDIDRPGQSHAWIVRSPHANAKIKSIDIAKAAAAEGVLAVFTGADMAADEVGSLPCGWDITNRDGSAMKTPPHPPLAVDQARHVGDQVALVIAESRALARDAAELVAIDYEPLAAVTATAAANKPGAPQVWDEIPDNLCYDSGWGDEAATDAAFKQAAHVTTLELINSRIIPNPIEPRVAIGEYDAGNGKHTLYTTSQNPHVIRLLMGPFVLGLAEHKLRVVAPDVGGGFGSKIFHYAEEAIVTWAAKKVGRPVKWTAERSEAFVSDAHGRDHVTTAELALDRGAKFLGFRVRITANMGAYLSTFSTSVPSFFCTSVLGGVYTTPAVYAQIKAVFTNTVPVDAYRGAGRAEANYQLERVVDKAARELGIDPVELRRRNLIPSSAMPYMTPMALEYDSGDFAANMDACLKAADYAGFEQRRAAAAKQGKLRGIGLSVYVEAAGLGPSHLAGKLGAHAGLYESAEVRVHPTGSVTVFTGSHSHGQGHETTFAQVVSEQLGVPLESIEIVHGDTDLIPFGMGTFGSRSIAVGGSAIMVACDKVIAKGKKIAAHMLEAEEANIAFADGVFSDSASNQTLTLGDIALSAYVPHNYPLDSLEPGLDETAFYDPPNFTYPNGCFICEVEIDEETGAVAVVSFTAVDDFGTVINPMVVAGQVHGGVTQGIGQALLENCTYDGDSGQLTTGSYMDYTLPRADDLPTFAVEHNEIPCAHNPIGAKGCGEAGATGSTAAVINAVINALAPLGIEQLDMPATPHVVWRAMQAAKAAAAE